MPPPDRHTDVFWQTAAGMEEPGSGSRSHQIRWAQAAMTLAHWLCWDGGHTLSSSPIRWTLHASCTLKVQRFDCATPEFLLLGLSPLVPLMKVCSDVSSVAVSIAQINKERSLSILCDFCLFEVQFGT